MPARSRRRATETWGPRVTAAFPSESCFVSPSCPRVPRWHVKSENLLEKKLGTREDPGAGGFHRETVTRCPRQDGDSVLFAELGTASIIRCPMDISQSEIFMECHLPCKETVTIRGVCVGTERSEAACGSDPGPWLASFPASSRGPPHPTPLGPSARVAHRSPQQQRCPSHTAVTRLLPCSPHSAGRSRDSSRPHSSHEGGNAGG